MPYTGMLLLIADAETQRTLTKTCHNADKRHENEKLQSRTFIDLYQITFPPLITKKTYTSIQKLAGKKQRKITKLIIHQQWAVRHGDLIQCQAQAEHLTQLSGQC